MVNELTQYVETSIPIPFTMTNAYAIEKGAVAYLYDPFTVSGHTAANSDQKGGRVPIAGVFAEEKIANVGATASVYDGGYWNAKISGNVTVGDILGASGNTLYTIASGAQTTGEVYTFGTAMETGVHNDTIKVKLEPRRINPYIIN